MPVLAAVLVPHPPLIVPAVGKGKEKAFGQTASAFREAMAFLARFRPETVVVVTPYKMAYSDCFHLSPGRGAEGNLGEFGASRVSVRAEYDEAFVRKLRNLCRDRQITASTRGGGDPELDIGTVIPLLFLKDALKQFRVVRIGTTALSLGEHYRLGQAVARAADRLGRRVVVVASGELSWSSGKDSPFGFSEKSAAFDRELTAAIERGDLAGMMSLSSAVDSDTVQTALEPLSIMAGAFDQRKVASNLLSYEAPFGMGWAVATFEGGEADPERNVLAEWQAHDEAARRERLQKEDGCVKVARFFAEQLVRTGKRPALDADADLLERFSGDLFNRSGAVSVTLYFHGRVRGQVLNVEPTRKNLFEEIAENAMAACSGETGYHPVAIDELDDLVYRVEVMGPLEKVTSAAELDPRVYGLLTRKGRRVGVGFPGLERIVTAEQQMEAVREEAGLLPGEPAEFFRFTVETHE